MCAAKMHADELEIDAALVRRLLVGQFPRWAELPVTPVASAGTDNAIYRLGDDMAVRLPRIRRVEAQVDKERRWLPRLAPQLPLAIPVPLAVGEPAEGCPWRWSVVHWLPGEEATAEQLDDLRRAAIDLAGFISALQCITPAGGPPPGEHNVFRGAPLALRDAGVRMAIAALDGMIDRGAVTAAWEAALQAPAWDRQPVWIHGDLHAGNLLAHHGRLSAVIDFGCLGVGDPACDVMPAWTLFSGESRDAFRAALAVDDATWTRARGWVLSGALIALPYYLRTNPVIVASSWRALAEVLADYGAGA